MREVNIEASWKNRLASEFAADYMGALSQFLRAEKAAGKHIYPAGSEIFAAFDMTPFDKVKVVILGQDPYHGAGQAHGLSFSVRHGIAPPPSLQNIYKELANDLGLPHPGHGNLDSWANQGVLLLNSTLTVREGEAGSHAGHGWETFTDAIISYLGSSQEHIVFILWGAHAGKKTSLIGQHHTT